MMVRASVRVGSDACQKLENVNAMCTGIPTCVLTHFSHCFCSVALETVSPSCSGGPCYDMLITAYTHTPERSVLATFTPSVSTGFLTSYKSPDGMYSSFAEANAGDGSTCLLVGTAGYDTVSPDAANVVDCSDLADCLAKLEAGECDLFVADNTISSTGEVQDSSIVSTGEVIGDVSFYAYPMASDLDPNAMVLLSKWHLDAAASGKLDELEATYFGGGSGGDGTSSASHFELAVSAAIIAVATLVI